MLGKIIGVAFLIIFAIIALSYFNHLFTVNKIISSTPVQVITSYTRTNSSLLEHVYITHYNYSFYVYSNTTSTISYPLKLPDQGEVIVVAYFKNPVNITIVNNGTRIFTGIETYLYKQFYGGGNLTLIFAGESINGSVLVNETIVTVSNS
ncbi:MAG: hypothetical protein JZD40_05230 [Sulfolobus sp.]|nr:hypothetical protein [Sulfolobus sp.]